MAVSAMPQYRFKTVLDITPDDLHAMGAKAVGLDIDNTIVFDGTMHFLEGVELWIQSIQNAGFPVTIISNAMHLRVHLVAKKVGLPYLAMAKKPRGHKLVKAAAKMGVPVSALAMVGDQLFSDMQAANACGAIAVYVDPMDGKTRYPRYYARRRRREAPILAEFEKKQGYGVQ